MTTFLDPREELKELTDREIEDLICELKEEQVRRGKKEENYDYVFGIE